MAPPEGWGENSERGWLERELEFKDFMAAMEFVNQVAEIAEELNHHPDILIHSWNRVRVASWSRTSSSAMPLPRPNSATGSRILRDP